MKKHKNKSNKYNDMNLEFVLKDPTLYAVFKDWSIANLCSENLMFYADVEEFKKVEDTGVLEQEAEKIFEKFVKDGAYNQINLDHETRQNIALAIRNKSYNRAMFDAAHFLIVDLIKYDLLVKFLDSDIYREYKGLPPLQDKRILPRKNSAKRVAKMPRICAESIYHLEKCLVDPVAIEEFLEFTRSEYSDSLLLFYLAVQKFREDPSVANAKHIFNKFLSAESTDEVDADPKIKKLILRALETEHVTRDLFDKLQSQVFAVMAQDNFFRFQLKMISRLAVI